MMLISSIRRSGKTFSLLVDVRQVIYRCASSQPLWSYRSSLDSATHRHQQDRGAERTLHDEQCSNQHMMYSNMTRPTNHDEEIISSLAYCLSFAPNDGSTDYARNFGLLFPNERMLSQLEFSKDQLKNSRSHQRRAGSASLSSQYNTTTREIDNDPLPRSLAEALHPSRRAIVITEAKKPFRIWNVNRAWEELCGYTFLESQNKTLGSLLHGPETDQVAATALIVQLFNGEEAGTTLINYKKGGQRFYNRIRVGPLVQENGKAPTHFVGVLQEVL